MARAQQWTIGYVIPSAAPELGVSISGGEAIYPASDDGASPKTGWSNANAGVTQTNYRYEGVTSTSTHNHLTFGFLAGRGWKTVKIPTKWERLTRNNSALTPDTLSTSEMALLDTEITEAASQGLSVIIDLHNYGIYYADGAFASGTAGTGYAQTLGITSAGVTWTNAFRDFWSAMASRYLANSTVIGFHLMNEPNSSVGTGALTRANWYTAAQAAVTAIRAVDTGGRFIIRVGGWSWSSVEGWSSSNPSGAWITDSVAPQNIWYEGHHYWDENGSGVYTTYATAVSHAAGRGFTTTFRGITYPDALYSMVLSDLYDFKQWLVAAGKQGVIGETGVPNQTTVSAGDETSWCALVTTYLAYARQLGGIAVDVWNCGEWQGGWSNQLSCYADSNRFVSGVDTAGTVSAPWEAALASGSWT